jgi:hypothetical protein
MMHNLNTQHITSTVSAVCVRVVLTGPAYHQGMTPVLFNLGLKAKGPPKGY